MDGSAQQSLGLKGVRIRERPTWFNIGNNTPVIHIERVDRGLHPLGGPLGPRESKCGNCSMLHRHEMSKTYLKCGARRWTFGAATDLRAGWRGCSMFEPKGTT